MRVVVASRNRGKVRELATLLSDVSALELVSLADVPEAPDVIEDGTTFQANAEKKALSAAIASGSLALADDSGLEVDALDGLPGIRSARFASEHATDAENNAALLAVLRDVPLPQRTARFRCVLVLAEPTDGGARICARAEGVCDGHLSETPLGDGGFGYDPLFVPADYAASFAELGEEAKNRISHRARAVAKMRAILLQWPAQ